MTYPIITVDENLLHTQLEQLGTKAKFWYLNNEKKLFLFKEGRPGTGENWAEKVCCEIANLLGLPHANYDLAKFQTRTGVVTPMFVPRSGRLVHGNELLAAMHTDYNLTMSYRASQHTLNRSIAAIRKTGAQLPKDWDHLSSELNAVGVFVGYLLLDALVGNQDRHHENWGLVLSAENGLRLAPSYDHASSLGRNELDKNRMSRLTTKDKGQSIEFYVKRAVSGFYDSKDDKKPMFTLDAFLKGAKIDSSGGRYWLQKLENIEFSSVENIVTAIPESEITKPGREFALRIIEVNKERLLNTGV